MKKKGFTLIELLAVIVILAIIALIITPVVSNIILQARISANARSVEGHIRNVELAIESKAFNADTGDLTNYDVTDGALSSDLVMPNNDDVVCEKYTITNGRVISASGCVSDRANWNKVYSYGNAEGAKSTGDYDNPNSGGNSGSNPVVINGGLYDMDRNLIKSWTELVELGLDVESDHTSGDVNGPILNSLTSEGILVIPNTVTKLGDYALAGATSLVEIEIPDTVTSIGGWAFGGCSNLRKIVIPNSVTTLAKWAFVDCKALNDVTISNKIERIEEYTFAGCTGLTSITLPNSVKYLGSSVFINDAALTSVTLSDELLEIGQNAFTSTGITSLTLPNKLEVIGLNVFSYSKLSSITFPSSLRRIDNGAFWNCSTLSYATFEDPNNWYAATTSTATSGTNLSLGNSATNAKYLKTTYTSRYWLKR